MSITELALVTHKPRAASAYAVGPSRCAGQLTSAAYYHDDDDDDDDDDDCE